MNAAPSFLRILFPRHPAQPAISSLAWRGESLLVLRKSVRTLRLQLDDAGALRLTAPTRLREAEILAFVESKAAWIGKQRERLAQRTAKAEQEAAALAGLSPAELRARDRKRRRALLAAAQAALPRWEAAMGLKASSLSIRAMRSRWGSCNIRTGKITLSLALADHSPECLDYILVHELAHLKVRKHNARFKAILSKHLPDWKRWNKVLAGQA